MRRRKKKRSLDMIKLLIADDEPLVLVGMQSMLDWASLGVERSAPRRTTAGRLWI